MWLKQFKNDFIFVCIHSQSQHKMSIQMYYKYLHVCICNNKNRITLIKQSIELQLFVFCGYAITQHKVCHRTYGFKKRMTRCNFSNMFDKHLIWATHRYHQRLQLSWKIVALISTLVGITISFPAIVMKTLRNFAITKCVMFTQFSQQLFQNQQSFGFAFKKVTLSLHIAYSKHSRNAFFCF